MVLRSDFASAALNPAEFVSWQRKYFAAGALAGNYK